jgi:hypothetical protein
MGNCTIPDGTVSAMTYRWQYNDSGGQEFESQEDAEAWLSDHWRELASAGVAEVTLLSSESEVYTMKLEPA